MDLAKIYQLLQQAVDFKHFMSLNNKIIEIEEKESLTNYRKTHNKCHLSRGKNKILNFINRFQRLNE